MEKKIVKIELLNFVNRSNAKRQNSNRKLYALAMVVHPNSLTRVRSSTSNRNQIKKAMSKFRVNQRDASNLEKKEKES